MAIENFEYRPRSRPRAIRGPLFHELDWVATGGILGYGEIWVKDGRGVYHAASEEDYSDKSVLASNHIRSHLTGADIKSTDRRLPASIQGHQ